MQMLHVYPRFFCVMTIQTVSNSAKDPGVTELGHRLVADEELAP